MNRYRIDVNRKKGFDIFDVHANEVIAWFAELDDAETFVAIKKGQAKVAHVD